MKTLATILMAILLTALFIGVWYIERKDFVSIPKSTWDSIQKVASTPPDTIRHTDTIFAPGTPVTIIQKVPIYIKENDSTLCYNDSLKNKDLAIFLSDKISTKGIILDRVWKYKLFVPLRIIDSITITKLVPVPIEYNTTGINIILVVELESDPGWSGRSRAALIKADSPMELSTSVLIKAIYSWWQPGTIFRLPEGFNGNKAIINIKSLQ